MNSSNSDAHCLVCGEQLGWTNGFKQQSLRQKREGKPPEPKPATGGKPAWYHADAMKRDHPAIPHDLRDHDVEAVKHARRVEVSEATVHKTLQRNFDYLDAEKAVNDVFKDRRG